MLKGYLQLGLIKIMYIVGFGFLIQRKKARYLVSSTPNI